MFSAENFQFLKLKNLCLLHGQVFVMMIIIPKNISFPVTQERQWSVMVDKKRSSISANAEKILAPYIFGRQTCLLNKVKERLHYIV